MASRILKIFFVLLINFNTFVSDDDTSCVPDLKSLIDDFKTTKTSTDNLLRIQDTFYPQNNEKTPHYVNVSYCYQEPCNSSRPENVNYTYIWADNRIFFVVDYHLFRALTFELADLGNFGEVYFVVPQPCDNNTEDIRDLLLTLTSQVNQIILFAL